MMAPDLLRWSREGGGDFRLGLIGASELECAEIVRRIPGRRLVCRGTWDGQPVYVKIFIGNQAARYAKRDARGASALAARNIATPLLLHTGGIAGMPGNVLIYAAIADSRDAESVWETSTPIQRSQLAAELMRTVAKHHTVGLIQADLYLRNFLCADRLYTLDGDGIRISADAIPWRRAMPNLALLLSKFDVEDDARIPELLEIYAAQRDWQMTDDMLSMLKKRVSVTRLAIARQYAQKKVLRDCTDVRVVKDFERFLAVTRSQQSDVLSKILDDPDAWLDRPDCRRLKNGNTCTVGLVTAGSQKIVIKRYNIKNLRHGLSRLWRPTRASTSWSNAHLLRMLGIATATPLALMEHRYGPLRREGYFFAEYVEGRDILEVFADPAIKEDAKREIARQVVRLLHTMYLLRLKHGDMKASNIKIMNDKPWLLDLDAMRTSRSAMWFELMHARELRRFLRNWERAPATLKLFADEIASAYGDVFAVQIVGWSNGKIAQAFCARFLKMLIGSLFKKY